MAAQNDRYSRYLSVLLRPRGYVGGVAAFVFALGLHLALLRHQTTFGSLIILGYLLALLYAAWNGYGAGILVSTLFLTIAPWLTRPGWTLRQFDWRAYGAFLALNLMTSMASRNRLRAEQALQKANEELDDRVRQRTAELEEANREHSRRVAEIEALYGRLTVGVGLLDRDLRFLRLNETLAAFNRRPLADHIGKHLRDVVPAEVADVIEPLYRRVLESGEPLTDLEVRGPRGINDDPAEYDRLIAATPVHTDDGAIVGLQIIVQDVTDRKRLERKLRETAKLESLGVLAGGIAHDFNNLLTGILGNASLAQDLTAHDPNLSSMLGNVVKASERAAELTQQLLAYAGKGRIRLDVMDLSALVNEIEPLVNATIVKRARLRFDLAPGCFVAGDSGQVQQIIMNLLINAAEAIPTERFGAITVRTGVERLDEQRIAAERLHAAEEIAPGYFVRLEVADDGCGMDGATLERIFDPFFTTKFTGRGLGLAAVLGIVRGHRGGLAVESAPGRGTTFRVFFPLSEQEPVEHPKGAASAHAQSDGYVLVVDDEEIVRRAARAGLESYGYRVLTASSGQEAVSLVERKGEGIVLVVLDLTMPDMDGAATFRAIRRVRDSLPVVLSSGYDEADAAGRLEGERFAGFLKKPYTAAALASKVSGVALHPKS